MGIPSDRRFLAVADKRRQQRPIEQVYLRHEHDLAELAGNGLSRPMIRR